MVVEVELHSGASFHQVDIHILIVLSTFNWAIKHLHFQVNQERHVTQGNQEDQEADSGEDETKVCRRRSLK